METGSQQTATTAIIKKAPNRGLFNYWTKWNRSLDIRQAGSTKRQYGRFGCRLRRHPPSPSGRGPGRGDLINEACIVSSRQLLPCCSSACMARAGRSTGSMSRGRRSKSGSSESEAVLFRQLFFCCRTGIRVHFIFQLSMHAVG